MKTRTQNVFEYFAHILECTFPFRLLANSYVHVGESVKVFQYKSLSRL